MLFDFSCIHPNTALEFAKKRFTNFILEGRKFLTTQIGMAHENPILIALKLTKIEFVRNEIFDNILIPESFPKFYCLILRPLSQSSMLKRSAVPVPICETIKQ